MKQEKHERFYHSYSFMLFTYKINGKSLEKIFGLCFRLMHLHQAEIALKPEHVCTLVFRQQNKNINLKVFRYPIFGDKGSKKMCPNN